MEKQGVSRLVLDEVMQMVQTCSVISWGELEDK